MKTRRTLIWGIALVILGVIGLAASLMLRPSLNGGYADSTYSSPGQRIYYTGLDENGDRIGRTIAGRGMTGMIAASACVDCHGEDGRGGTTFIMMQTIEIPDIRYSSLTSTHSESGSTSEGWTEEEIATAIRDGIEPDGERLERPMPRWDMTDAQVSDVIDYLKELDRS